MNQITEIIISSAMGILTILAGIVVQSIKSYLITKGGERAVKIAEIVAMNAVQAVEQVSVETGYKGAEKLTQAKSAIVDELLKYNIHMTDAQLDTFIESAVKQMNDAWIR
ncbi:phage holin [Streptococcus thoraltensis]|uniref:phage holin n=1 Tax=Streptococcus thoraltensis TaxID=55085 RepID=UPI000361BDB9|nr:phage holin [Streptococcus thoraltensis]QBX31098.1 holin [Streptococcus phage Javan616]